VSRRAERVTRTRYIAQAGVIAAVYAGATIIVIQFLGWLAVGPIQLRASEALTVAAFLTPAAIPGLALGSVVANIYSFAVLGSPLALLDVVFGSLATFIGAAWTWRFRRNTPLGLAGPVVSNSLIVAAYLPWLAREVAGLYEVPILGVDLEGRWLPMYLFGVVAIGIGQAVVMYGLGWPLLAALKRLRPIEP